MNTTIGIIGAGNIGKALAKHFSSAGYPVLIANSRGADSLKELAKELGSTVTATSALEASKAEVIILAVGWAKIPAMAKAIPDWTGKIVIDASNNILSSNPRTLDDLGGKTTGAFVSGLLPGAHVIKAFNTLRAQVLGADPVSAGGNRVIVLSGDNSEAKAKVCELISAIKFQPIDLGSLSVGGKLQEVGASLSNIDLYKGNDSAANAIEVVRQNTEEVQGKGNFELFEQLFAEDFVDHTTQPGFGNDKNSVKNLYGAMRTAFPDFRADIHWMTSDGDKVTTFKTYHGTHLGPIFDIEPTGRIVQFETVDVMRVRDGKITDHWGVANLLSLIKQLSAPAQ